MMSMQKRMDWKKIGFDWNRARAFLATAEEGTLSGAARVLGLTQPTLGRQVAALEQELDVVLFERVGHSLILTPSGLELLEHVKRMADAANSVALTASGQSQELEGTVCISASEVHAAFWLGPIIDQLRHNEPKIIIEIVSTNSVSDLQLHEADIAIRNFRPTQPELIAKKIGDICARLYASTSYLQRFPEALTKQTLCLANFISFENTSVLLNGFNAMGYNLTQANFPLQTNSYMTHWSYVKQGLGIGLMPDNIGDREPAVSRVLPEDEYYRSPVWLTVHRGLHTSRRVRVVFDLLAVELERLMAPPIG
mgnify:CR=1 FL=1